MPIANPTAFDAFAGDYDDLFTRSTLGRLLRLRVWEKLADHFSSGQHVLELACGTGEDAVWLAGQGIRVTAPAGSAGMIRATEAKAKAAGVQKRSTALQRSFQGITAQSGAWSASSRVY